jgi:rubrerythrin
MVENLTKEKKTLEKQVQRLKDEEEEKEKAKRRKQTRKKLRCERCGVESTENQWEDNGGTCPSCDRGIMERAMEVQV